MLKNGMAAIGVFVILTMSAITMVPGLANAANSPPVLDPVGDKAVDEGALLTFTATATDPDLPFDTLTFSVVGAPAGASMTTDGVFTWTPLESQGPGSYTFDVAVADDYGLDDSEAITVVVNEVSGTGLSPPLLLTGQAFAYSIRLSWEEPVDDGGSPITAYALYRASLGDGVACSGDPGVWQFLGEVAMPASLAYEDFSANGGCTYTYKVTAVNSESESRPSSHATVYSNFIPVARFSIDFQRDNFVQLDPRSSYDVNGRIVHYYLGWGDRFWEDYVDLPIWITHVYLEPGTYTITLTVRDDLGAQDMCAQEVLVSYVNQPPIAAFGYTVDGLVLSVNGTGAYDTDGTIVNWYWDFGDGSTESRQPILAHAYRAAGTYIVALTVTDDDGATGVASLQVTIEPGTQPPEMPPGTVTVALDSGELWFPGEIVVFHALLSYEGTAVDPELAEGTLYGAGAPMSLTPTRVALGLYEFQFELPATYEAGTYTLVVAASYRVDDQVVHGIAMKDVQVSATLLQWQVWLIDMHGDLAQVYTDVGYLNFSLSSLRARLTSIEDGVAVLSTSLGAIRTDLATIAASIVSIDGNLVTVSSKLGALQTTVDAIDLRFVDISRNIATVVTSLGTFEVRLFSVETGLGNVGYTLNWVGNAIGNLTIASDDIHAMLAEIHGTVLTIRSDIGDLQVDVAGVNATVQTIWRDVITVSTSIGTIQTCAESLDARLVSIEGSLATVYTTLGLVRTEVDAIGAAVVAIDGRIATVETSVGNIALDVDSIGATVTGIDQRTVTIATDIGVVKADVTDIEAQVTAINGRTATIRTDLGDVQADLHWVNATIMKLFGKTVKIQTTVGTIDVNQDQVDMDYIAWAPGARPDFDPAALVGPVVLVPLVLALAAGRVLLHIRGTRKSSRSSHVAPVLRLDFSTVVGEDHVALHACLSHLAAGVRASVGELRESGFPVERFHTRLRHGTALVKSHRCSEAVREFEDIHAMLVGYVRIEKSEDTRRCRRSRPDHELGPGSRGLAP